MMKEPVQVNIIDNEEPVKANKIVVCASEIYRVCHFQLVETMQDLKE